MTATTDPAAFLTAVFNERGWEFFAEMNRRFDLVRLEKAGQVRSEAWGGFVFRANGPYYFPVPYRQINLTGWTNNPG